ncbi:MAG: hypothetical protein AABX85_03970 [Nanoarchaeota archaeon]
MIPIGNKKGEEIVLPATAQILIAIVCIAGLVYLAVAMFSSFINNTEKEQAKSALEEISSKVIKLPNGASDSYLYIAPKKWYFKDTNVPGLVPECKESICLCLCSESDCSKSNVCKGFDKVVIVKDAQGNDFSGVKIEEIPLTFTLKNETDGFVIQLKTENK